MITVHDRGLCEQVLGLSINSNDDNVKHRQTGRDSITNTPVPVTRANSTRLSRRIDSTMFRTKEWLGRKSRRNVMILPIDHELQQMQSKCDVISMREASLLEDIETFLEAQSAHTQCKKEMLFKQWSERVFEPLQSALRVNQECNEDYMDTRRRQIFDKYLSMTNKTNIFLDTFDVNEYDPMLLLSNDIPAKTIELSDPLTMQQVDHLYEQQLIEGCVEGVVRLKPPTFISKCNGRQDTDPVMWLAMKLIQIDSNIRQRTRLQLQGTRNSSHINNEWLISSSDSKLNCTTHNHKNRAENRRDTISLAWKT